MKNLLFLFSIILFVSSVKAENTSSFKHNNIFNCTEVVKLLQPKQYYYDTIKDPTLSNQLQFGLLAQDLLKIPELKNIVSEDDKGYLVDYVQVIPILTVAIQDLIKENNVIKSDIRSIQILFIVILSFFILYLNFK